MAVTGPTAWNNPDFYVGKPILSQYEPYPVISGTAYSSNAPASIEFIPWEQPAAIYVSNIVLAVSMNASVPQASSQNSSGSEGYTYAVTANIFGRQDYTSNSTNLSFFGSGLFRLTATQSYSSGSQSYGLSWVTNTTGGTSGVSTTSGDGNWSSSGTGAKMISIPYVGTLPAGEYWIGFQHSSTAATSGSSVVLHSFSKFQQAWPVVSAGVLGQTVSQGFLAHNGWGFGVASGVTTSTTMAISAISATVQPVIYFALSNA